MAPPLRAPPAAVRVPRVRRVETFKCWIPLCPETVTVDRDLEEKVRTIPVMKAQSPHGTRVEPLLMFPQQFYLICEEHRKEKYGYRNIYEALAWLLAETRLGKKLAVTKATLKEVGLDSEDLSEIQAIEATWL